MTPRLEVDPENAELTYLYIREGDEHLPVWSTVVSEDPLIVVDRCKCHDEVYGVEVVS